MLNLAHEHKDFLEECDALLSNYKSLTGQHLSDVDRWLPHNLFLAYQNNDAPRMERYLSQLRKVVNVTIDELYSDLCEQADLDPDFYHYAIWADLSARAASGEV